MLNENGSLSTSL